jgi:hypothetical protein
VPSAKRVHSPTVSAVSKVFTNSGQCLSDDCGRHTHNLPFVAGQLAGPHYRDCSLHLAPLQADDELVRLDQAVEEARKRQPSCQHAHGASATASARLITLGSLPIGVGLKNPRGGWY